MWVPQRRSVRLLVAGVAVTFISIVAFFTVTPASPPETEAPFADLAGSAPTPDAAPIAAAAIADSAAATPTAAATAQARTGTQFERVLHAFLLEARRRRDAAAAHDPSYWTRIDPRLNASRLNFLLFGYGETHEPPLTERAFIGSLTIFSYDYKTRSIDLISLTHDIRAPEVERFIHTTTGQPSVGPIKIDQAYGAGGFELMRKTIEDATGLSVDFELAFKESAIAGATDDVFEGLDVDVPLAFDVNGFYLDGVKYPGGSFPEGRQHLNGMQVIQFIKTVPVEQHYDARLEHNARKHLVFRAIMDGLQQHSTDVPFLGRAAVFFTSQVANESIAYDFDLKSLLVDNLRGLMRDTGHGDESVPGIARTLYVVDPASGDGSVQWVQANAHDNPITQRDIDERRYGELAMEVPYHGDPYAEDLVAGYWPDVRKLIASRLAD